MKYGLAVTSGLVFAITWPRIYPPPTRVAGHHLQRVANLRNNNKKIHTMPPITYALLAKQNAETSNALIEHWTNTNSTLGTYFRYVACSREGNQQADFIKLANYEGNSTVTRDNEDAEKLQLGIDFAKEKGVIDPKYVPEPYVKVDVLGKSPDTVADEIIGSVKSKQTTDDEGSVIVICGLSGTGKVRITHKI